MVPLLARSHHFSASFLYPDCAKYRNAVCNKPGINSPRRPRLGTRAVTFLKALFPAPVTSSPTPPQSSAKHPYQLRPVSAFVGERELSKRGMLMAQAGKQRVVKSRSGDDDDGCPTAELCGAELDDVAHLSDWLDNLPLYDSPLKSHPQYRRRQAEYFIQPDDVVTKQVVVNLREPREATHFRRAGPREKIVFASDEVRAAIVTCGGLCPGLNTVIREIVCSLWVQYNVRDILGIEAGYRGFYAKNTIQLSPRVVNDIHKKGGTTLGTSRGGHDPIKIVNAIQDRGINQVYICGGDGTQRGADVIHRELVKRGLKVAVAGIPKTIDNDIPVIDKSFGFDTAVEEAQRAINAAHIEAESVENGVGLVKLMGRYSGYIAMFATLGSRDVDCCLIPEVPFYLEGKGGLFEFVHKRLKEQGHMVIVVAEGAGQELMALDQRQSNGASATDLSGNRLLMDVGLWLGQKLKDHFVKARNEILNLKYIDPTYMIRAIPSNASDNVYCTLLAHSAVHGVMAGYTGFTVGPVNGRHAYIPITRVTERQNRVNPDDRMWARLVSSTNQPDFDQPETAGSQEDGNHKESEGVAPEDRPLSLTESFEWKRRNPNRTVEVMKPPEVGAVAGTVSYANDQVPSTGDPVIPTSDGTARENNEQ